MINPEIKNLIKDFTNLSETEKANFVDYVAKHSEETSELTCPICGAKGKGVRKDGKSTNGHQRYSCTHCHHRFGLSTGTVLYATKKDFSVWKKFISCFLEGYSVRKTAEMISVNKNTAFLWRHKICESLNIILNETTLAGIIEANRTYFNLSFKGSTVPAEMKAKIHEGASNGVCVPCAVNHTGKGVARIAEIGRTSVDGLDAVLGNHIRKGSIFCVDSNRSFKKLAARRGLKRVCIRKGSKGKKNRNIKKVNSYQESLKEFVDVFNGVSTKHLNNYLMYYNFARLGRDNMATRKTLLANHILTADSYIRRKDIPKKPAVPTAL